MLTLKNLNDRSYQDILESAKELIPRIFPEWTDLRAHDPGITFVELFAWLTELLENYQNKVTYRNCLKFLKLLNIRPKDPECAHTYISVKDVLKPAVVPAGTRVYADGIPFETQEAIALKPLKVEVVAVSDGKRTYEVFRRGEKSEIEFSAFGDRPAAGNAMYIGLDGEYEGGPLFVKIDITRNQWIRNSMTPGDDFSLSRLRWEYLEDAAGDRWVELKVLEDETHELTFSGVIKLLLPGFIGRGNPRGVNRPGLFYIRCLLMESGYEMPPRIKSITLNTVKAVHGRTLSKVYYFSGMEDKSLVLQMDGYLPFYGICQVKVKDEKGFWTLWDERASSEESCGQVYRIERNGETGRTTVTFGTSVGGNIPARGNNNIMVIAYDKAFYENSRITFQRALPNQVFRLDWAIDEDLIFPCNFKLHIGNKLPEEKYFRWVDFERVDDLSNSRGNDRHFVLDRQKREIHFGNNEIGAMPGGIGENVIEIVQCTVGCGSKGNIKENKIMDMCEPFSGKYSVTNPWGAFGGHDGENLEEALKRLLSDMKEQYRAVTLKDYEEAALSTPGLMVARAKAIPQFVKGQKDYPGTRFPGQLTVVVVPYGREEKPLPSKAFIHRVKKYLEAFRLITTELHVIPPEYVKIKVRCTVAVLPHIRFDEGSVVSMLKEFLSPIGGKNFSGWPFGGTVRKGDIVSRISSIAGVEYIKDIQLLTDGEGIQYEKSGDIAIPPYALVYSDEHEVEIISRE